MKNKQEQIKEVQEYMSKLEQDMRKLHLDAQERVKRIYAEEQEEYMRLDELKMKAIKEMVRLMAE